MELGFFVMGFTLLGACIGGVANPVLFEWVEGPRFDRMLSAEVHRGPAGGGPVEAPVPGSVLARLEIPTAGVSSLVVEGVGDLELSRALGRIPGTARFGERGTVGVAGHRDSQFRDLGRVRSGDLVTITTPEATYGYAVDTTLTVRPDSVEVLNSSGVARLALVTCYPFRYIGPAPQRFVVLARQVTADYRSGVEAAVSDLGRRGHEARIEAAPRTAEGTVNSGT